MSTFDHPDRLNDDGTVTLRMVPSNWRRNWIGPDTYQMFNGDSWTESTIQGLREESGMELNYDDITWTYDHSGIVRALAEELADWMSNALRGLGLESITDMEVIDTWSPSEYNFVSDGFEVKFTCDPAQLRSLTEDFDVDAWAEEHYCSVDGFMSFVTSRMDDDTWHGDYDGEFRIESLLGDPDDADWRWNLDNAEDAIYSMHVQVEVKDSALEYMNSGYTLQQLEEWAEMLAPNVSIMESLF